MTVVWRYRKPLALTLLSVLVCCLALRLVWVHDRTWEWRLQPRAIPEKIMVQQRSYTVGETLTTLPAGVHLVGHDPGGAELYAYETSGLPTGLYAKDGARIVSYGLLGGP
ncbi:hypothetical protein [Angustibacter luteus]|uniref:Uncharacterized protein n=1 Tax=Angustibacter luteus TaxID=658456 RepID=A0ABW1JF18_9ACTN